MPVTVPALDGTFDSHVVGRKTGSMLQLQIAKNSWAPFKRHKLQYGIADVPRHCIWRLDASSVDAATDGRPLFGMTGNGRAGRR